MPTTIVVTSRPAIAHTVPDAPFIVVSVADPGEEEAVIAPSSLCHAVLRLSFDDAAPRQGQTPRGKALMREEDADTVLDFVRRHITASDAQPSVTTIVCQCEMGRSRSAGVAAALSQILNGDDSFYFANYTPNRWVYQTILNRHGKNVNKTDMNNPCKGV